MADPRFVEMLELVRAGKSKTTDDMLDKAIGIVNEALDGKLGEDDSMRLSTAMKLIARFPDPTEPVITFRRWGGYDMKSLPDDRRQRIFEEIEDDKSLKSAALPVSHVGNTKLGISKKKKKIEGETDDGKD